MIKLFESRLVRFRCLGTSRHASRLFRKRSIFFFTSWLSSMIRHRIPQSCDGCQPPEAIHRSVQQFSEANEKLTELRSSRSDCSSLGRHSERQLEHRSKLEQNHPSSGLSQIESSNKKSLIALFMAIVHLSLISPASLW